MKHSPEVDNLLTQARVLRDIGRAGESLPLLERALATAPFDDEMLCHLSLAYLTLKEWEKSLAAADKALSTNPISEWAHRLRSSSLSMLGRAEEALASAHNAARHKPDAPIVLYHLGEMLRRYADYNAAEATGKRLLQVAPEDVRAHLLLTGVYKATRQWANVERFALTGLQINAENAILYRRLGEALMKQERNGEAIQAYLHSLQIEPTDKQTQAQFRQVCFRIGLPSFSQTAAALCLITLLISATLWELSPLAALGVTAVLTFLSIAVITTLSPAVLLLVQPAYRRLPASARRQIVQQYREDWPKTYFAIATMVFLSLMMLAAALLITRL